MWSKFVEVQCAFAVAEVRKVTANLSQTCGLAVAELSVNLRCPALSFTNSKKTYDDGINRYLKKEHFYSISTNGETIKRNWMLCSKITGMVYCSVCKLFAVCETHFPSGFNDWKHIYWMHEHKNSESHRNASLSFASFKTKNAQVNHSFLVQIDKEKV